MRTPVRVIAMALGISSLHVVRAEHDLALCPPPQPLPADADDHRMSEADFSVEKAQAALQYLGREVPKLIYEHPGVDWAKGREGEGFRISYPNAIRTIEGALLKQEAIRLRERASLLKAPPGNEPSPDYNETLRASNAATERFCKFLLSATYVD